MSWLSSTRQREIDEKIETIRAETGLDYPSQGLLDIIYSYIPDVQVKEYDFGSDSKLIKGAIKYADGSGPAILINKERLYPAERTFTLAHEFGHYVLHEKTEKFRLDLFNYSNNSKESAEETEANYFAASLLMPKKEVEAMQVLTKDPEVIAKYFGVSKSAIEKRIEWLAKNKI